MEAKRDSFPTPLLIAHGLGDVATTCKIMDHASCCRIMTPAVPVAIEMCAGSGDGGDHKLGAKMGTVKGGTALSTTKRVPVVQASCGRAHTIMLEGGDKGGVRVCGDNLYGQLGLGHRQSFALVTKSVPFFRQPSLTSPVTSVAAGADFCTALLEDGRAFSWGNNRAGQLGLGILAAKLEPLKAGQKCVEISDLVPGGALECTEKISTRDRIAWFQSAIPGSQRYQVGQGDWSDESSLGALGICGQIELHLAVFARRERQQIQRMQRRKAALDVLLEDRYQHSVVSDQAVAREIARLDAACTRRCREAHRGCESEIEELSAGWEEEGRLFHRGVLQEEACARARAWMLLNRAHCKSGSKWASSASTQEFVERLTAAMRGLGEELREHVSGVTDHFAISRTPSISTGAGAQQASEKIKIEAEDAVQQATTLGKNEKKEQRPLADALAPREEEEARARREEEEAVSGRKTELLVTLESARHLPKMDVFGTCDAFCEVEWQGQKYKTAVKKNSYSPDWNETFTFRVDSMSGVSSLSVRVMDWDLASKNDVVGEVVVPADALRALSQGPHAATKVESLAVLHKGKAVVGKDKQPCVLNLKMRLVVAPVAGGDAAAAAGSHRREACDGLVVAAGGETTKRETPDSPAEKAGKGLAADAKAAAGVVAAAAAAAAAAADKAGAEKAVADAKVMGEAEAEANAAAAAASVSMAAAAESESFLLPPHALAAAQQLRVDVLACCCRSSRASSASSASSTRDLPALLSVECCLLLQGEWGDGAGGGGRRGMIRPDSHASGVPAGVSAPQISQIPSNSRHILDAPPVFYFSQGVTGEEPPAAPAAPRESSLAHLPPKDWVLKVDVKRCREPLIDRQEGGLTPEPFIHLATAHVRVSEVVKAGLAAECEASAAAAAGGGAAAGLAWVHVKICGSGQREEDAAAVSMLLRLVYWADTNSSDSHSNSTHTLDTHSTHPLALNGDEVLAHERQRTIAAARLHLARHLRQLEEQEAAAARSITSDTLARIEDVRLTRFFKGQKRHCVGLVLEKAAACSVGPPRGHAGRRPAPPPASAAGGLRVSDKGAGCVFVVKRLVAGSPAARCGRISIGDVLEKVDGEAVRGDAVLPQLLFRLSGARGSCVDVGLVGGASKEAYVVSLEREGGMRAIDIRQIIEEDTQQQLVSLREKYALALAATHERVRVGQQPRGACDEDELRILLQADEQGLYTSELGQKHALQAHISKHTDELNERKREALKRCVASAAAARERVEEAFVRHIQALEAAEAAELAPAQAEARRVVRSACEARASKERAWAEEREQLRARRAEEVAEKRAACEVQVQGMRHEQRARVAALQQKADEERPEERPAQERPAQQKQKAQGKREHAGGEGGGSLLRWWGVEELGKEEEEEEEAQMARLEALQLTDVLQEREELRRALDAARLKGEVAACLGVETPPLAALCGAAREFEVRVVARGPEDVDTPRRIWSFDSISPVGVREIACGFDHAVAVVADATLWSWGCNHRGQLGLGDRHTRQAPALLQVALPRADARLKEKGAVSCGNAYTLLIIEVPSGEGRVETSVVGWGRNERDQLGLNHAAEIRSWFWALSCPAGWHGVEVPDVGALYSALSSPSSQNPTPLTTWHRLLSLSQRKLELMLEAGEHASAAASMLPLFLQAREMLASVYSTNVRRAECALQWVYSAHDHLAAVTVPQGLFFGRDGKVFASTGCDVLGETCACQEHAGFPTASLICSAHGEPLRWRPEMNALATYPPAERWCAPEQPPSSSISVPASVAKPQDFVRVGVYPQDGGLVAGKPPSIATGLKNASGGGADRQYGDKLVLRQMQQLTQMFDDPLSTGVTSFHYDGAIHFPYFISGRQTIARIQCGDEYTAVFLSNGETRFLGDVRAAVRRLQSLAPKAAPGKSVKHQAYSELPYVVQESTRSHLGLLGTTVEKVLSKPVEKEHLLVRAHCGTQKPRALMRLTFSQLHRLTFPYHT